jgi:membrane protease YdiL (CAAX protease family)
MHGRGPSWHWWWLALLAPAVLSPAVFAGVRALAVAVEGPAWLEAATFSRVFQRLLTVSVLAVAVPWFWARGVRDRSSLGLAWEPGCAGLFSAGAAIGLLLAAAQLGAHLATGAREWDWELAPGRAAGIAVTALAVAFFEEAIFRGALLRVLRQGLGTAAAIAAQAMIFATAHFLKVPGFGADFAPRPWSGFALLAAVPGGIFSGDGTAIRWFVLFMLGAALGIAAVRWRGIWWCAGFHAVIAGAALALPRIADYEGGPWRVLCAKSPDASPDAAVLFTLALLGLLALPRARAASEAPRSP